MRDAARRRPLSVRAAGEGSNAVMVLEVEEHDERFRFTVNDRIGAQL